MRRLLHSVFIALALAPCVAFAQTKIEEQDGLGLTLEELISEKGVLRFEFGTTMSASRSDGVAGLFQSIQTGTGEYVSVPVEVGSTDRRSETAITKFGLRYGLTARSEVYARALSRFEQSLSSDSTTGVSRSSSNASFQNFVLGANYRLLDDGRFPGVIGFADVAVIENAAARGTQLRYGRSGTIGVTAYRVLDPVVLSLTAGYRINLERGVDGTRLDPGDALFINPSVGFAVNNELTLTGGFGLNFVSPDKRAGVAQRARETNADLQFGLAYAWNKNTTLRADARTEVLGERDFTVGLTLTRKIGRE